MEPSTGFANILPNQGQRWTGFWHSDEKKTGNRYTAKCKYCLVELKGKPDRLHQHVTRCKSWPVTERANYLKEASKQAIPERKRIRYGQDTITTEETND